MDPWMIFLSILLSFWRGTIIVNGVSCYDYSTDTACLSGGNCAWTGSICVCGSDYPQDILILMDSSGSVTSGGWANEEDFVSSLITTGLTTSTRVGVIQYSTAVNTRWTFEDRQDRATISRAVQKLKYLAGTTHMKDAINQGILDFQTYGNASIPRLMMMITDGNPYPSDSQYPCLLKDTLDDEDIMVVVIGVGPGWSLNIISCLVDNVATQIINATSFSNDDLAAVRKFTDAWLCPSNVQVQLTEVRVESGDAGGTSRFIEFYNTGHGVDLSSNPLGLTGYVTGSLNSGNWTTGAYLVVYDPDGLTGDSLPLECKSCECGSGTLGATFRCSNTKYVACVAPGCTFDTSMNNSYWSQKLEETTSAAATVKVDVVNHGTQGFPPVYTGWTFELAKMTYDASLGSSWVPSCFSEGTPGDAPLTNCTATCIEEICKSGGDSGALCNDDSTRCVCTAAEHYFVDGLQCTYLPPVTCTTTVLVRPNLTYVENYEQIIWTATSLPNKRTYQVDFVQNSEPDTKDVVDPVRQAFYYDSDLDASTEPEPNVTVKINDYDTHWTYSEVATCPFVTMAPTREPTPAPTYAIPVIDSCNFFLPNLRDLLIEWTDATLNVTAGTPDIVSGYRLFMVYEGIPEVLEWDSATTQFNITLNWDISHVSVFTLSVSPYVYNAEDELMLAEMFASSTVCIGRTKAPTDSPTSAPTDRPTKSPTGSPIATPTEAPTYAPYSIVICVVTVIADDSLNVDFVWTGGEGQEVTYYYDLDSGTPATFGLCKGFDGNATCTSGQVCKCNNVFVAGFDPTSTIFQMWPEWPLSPGGLATGGPDNGAVCSIVTAAPTAAPSREPTDAPTDQPTRTPTFSPTGAPTTSPTARPTYQELVVDCTYTLQSFRADGYIDTFVIAFTEPDFDPTGHTTPTASNSQYLIQYAKDDSTFTSATALAQSTNGAFSHSITLTKSLLIAPEDVANYTVFVTVQSRDDVALGSASQCLPITPAPTPSPTTQEPTPGPTFESPYIYFDVPNRCPNTTRASDGAVIPICRLEESNSEVQQFRVIRKPGEFGPNIKFDWSIVFMDPITGMTESITYADSDDFSVTTGKSVVIDGADSGGIGVKDISFLIVENKDRSTKETAYLVLQTCSSVTDSDIYSCSLATTTDGSEPTIIKIVLEQNTPDVWTNVTVSELPEWIWYPIAGGILILALLTFIGYRWYKKRQFAESQKHVLTMEMGDAQDLDALDEFGAVGDNIQFNPLATGGQTEIPTVAQAVERELDKARETEFAKVDTVAEVHREAFGQVKPGKKE